MERALQLLFPPFLQAGDVERWCQQGFVFSAFEGTSQFGLVQARGGPCGVLAVVQAYLFADCLYSPTHRTGTIELSAEQREAALVRALATVLLRCGGGDSAAVVMLDESEMEEEEAGAVSVGAPRADNLTVLEADGVAGAEVCVRAALPQLQSPMGAVLFVLSAVLSRGVDEVREDMDDSGAALTANFGHCTQELMNLLLTGYATGNVHDGAKAMGDSGLMLRGVVARQSVGYLTFLEALRYVRVGSFYKAPLLPVWVVGSESHYSVLCADAHVPGVTTNTAGQELFAASKRTFDASDAASNGFVPQGEVGALLLAHSAALRGACVALDAVARARAAEWSAQLEALRERLDAKATETGGILLWSNFREGEFILFRGAALTFFCANPANDFNLTCPRVPPSYVYIFPQIFLETRTSRRDARAPHGTLVPPQQQPCCRGGGSRGNRFCPGPDDCRIPHVDGSDAERLRACRRRDGKCGSPRGDELLLFALGRRRLF